MRGARARLRRAIKAVVPRRVRVRYRLREHSTRSRVNVTVLLRSGDHRRWIRGTPDTLRVGMLEAGTPPARYDQLVTDSGRHGTIAHGDDRDVPLALAALGQGGADLAVVGAVTRPRWWNRRNPKVEPAAIAVTRPALEEVCGAPPWPDLVGLHLLLRDAGRRVAIVPTSMRTTVRATRHDLVARPTIVVLAAIPLHDVGGGSRSAQLALELLRQGFHVIYVSLFSADESIDIGLRFIHPELEQYSASEFDAFSVTKRSRRGVVILEVPAGQFSGPVEVLRRGGWRLVYDIVDLWQDRSLGGDWYRHDVEKEFLTSADLVTASAPDLVELAAEVGVDAILLPNGVNAEVFRQEGLRRPGDLPEADLILGYHGSLYGDWFDWGSLNAVARRFPSAAVAVIGDPPDRLPPRAANISLLGLKAHSELPDYLARFDVGLIPFVVNATTHAVSPLKAYEYLAAGVPVAAPPLRSLRGLAGVFTADDLVSAVEQALEGGRPDREQALRKHSWEARVEMLLDAIGQSTPGGGVPPRIVTRPAMHYRGDQRRLTGHETNAAQA